MALRCRIIVLHYSFLISLTTSFRIVFTDIMVHCSWLSIKSFGVEQVGANGFIMTRYFLVYTLSVVGVLQKFCAQRLWIGNSTHSENIVSSSF